MNVPWRRARGGRGALSSARAATKRVHATNGGDVGRRFACFASGASRRPLFRARLDAGEIWQALETAEARTREEKPGACHVPSSRSDCVCAFLRCVREPDEVRPGAWSGWVCRAEQRQCPKKNAPPSCSLQVREGKKNLAEEKGCHEAGTRRWRMVPQKQRDPRNVTHRASDAACPTCLTTSARGALVDSACSHTARRAGAPPRRPALCFHCMNLLEKEEAAFFLG